MGKSMKATGKSKQEARALAAEKLLLELLPKEEPKKSKKKMKDPSLRPKKITTQKGKVKPNSLNKKRK